MTIVINKMIIDLQKKSQRSSLIKKKSAAAEIEKITNIEYKFVEFKILYLSNSDLYLK